jgi:hypothetical protein
MYDINGNYIETKQDKKNKDAKLKNRLFTEKMDCFLKLHNIKGIANSYGFSTTDKLNTIDKLNKIGIIFKIDYSNIFNVKILINKTELQKHL